ncbi:MAG: phage portal protein [Acetanaerobacterium sp.]
MKGLVIEELAIHSAINLIAGAVGKCEFRTFRGHKEHFGEEYYLWNYEPNRNQNSSQFLQELVARLLYFNEVLVVEVGGQLLIAEGFIQEEFALRDSVFTQVRRGTLTFNRPFSMSEVLYFRLNNTNIKLWFPVEAKVRVALPHL